MPTKEPVILEMYYTFTCTNCRVMKHLLDDVLPQFGDKFVLKKRLANGPVGMIRTMKLGIHSVPALVIDCKVVYRSVPTKEELISKLNKYL